MPSTRCCEPPTTGSRRTTVVAYARARAGESASRIVDGVRVRISRSLETYAGWLAHRASAAHGRIFRLHPSPVELPGAVPIDGPRLSALVVVGPVILAGTAAAAGTAMAV